VCSGYEVQELSRLLGIDVIGTDISPTASQFPNVLQWDFHDVKQEWIENVDFVYSNSWDHSFDLERLFKNWMECLKPSGRLFISWTPTPCCSLRRCDCFSSFENSRKLLKVRRAAQPAIFIARCDPEGHG